MPKITVASQNPVKLKAALNAFSQMFPDGSFEVAGVSVPSGVADQPMSVSETMAGAKTRAENARAAAPEADFWVGIEGGVEDSRLGMACFARVHVLGRDGVTGLGQTAVFYLPQEVAELVRGGLELGHADDRVFGRDNSKQANGAIGLLTDDVVDREAYYSHAVIMALVPFKNRELSW
ncbi:MAG: inosine/xanthosine triphosphatase [Chloroflexota bacterium]|nr:inosine/xanthosine triphosphatase [Chloroflexota bacterium]MDE2948242.1 inosine/xanthosine triphosphatase [Chloroflexota bacterium]